MRAARKSLLLISILAGLLVACGGPATTSEPSADPGSIACTSRIITDWLIAFGTLLLAFVAIFQDWIRARVWHPELHVCMDFTPPYCHKAILRGRQVRIEADCYYFRLRVSNSGHHRAEMVEVYAAQLSKQQADGSFKEMNSFLPMNLLWSHINKPYDAISPEMEKLCNLGHIVEPPERSSFAMEDDPRLGIPPDKTVFSFDVATPSYTMSHLIPPGIYHLDLLVAAANAKRVKKTVEIIVTGKWFDDEERMLGEGIAIRTL